MLLPIQGVEPKFARRDLNVEAQSNAPTTSGSESPDELRAQRDQMATRQKRLADLLNCPPEKIEHEVRNVLNELRLLRTLFQSQEKT